jgi:hypothetical protein
MLHPGGKCSHIFDRDSQEPLGSYSGWAKENDAGDYRGTRAGDAGQSRGNASI